MEIVYCNKNYSESINFIDSNEVFLGFDYSSKCCEDFGYITSRSEELNLSDAESISELDDDLELEGYDFDREYFNQEYRGLANYVTFRCVKDGAEDIYLTIYNRHNGYYWHGFNFKNKEEVILEDLI